MPACCVVESSCAVSLLRVSVSRSTTG
jgi:hypothetical protein